MGFVETMHHAELLKFGIFVQPIAALSLYGGDSKPHHCIKPLPARLHQLLFRRFTGGICSLYNATSPFHYLHVAIAPHPP